MMTAAAARGPVTLRDFLELACDSSSDGFRSYPRCIPCSDDALQVPVRLLVEADLRRSPSRSPSSLFSRSPGPGALARISSLSRSFSRRIKEGFWRRREDDEDVLYFDDRDSCGFPSPIVSSCSASDSESEYAEADVASDDKMACPSVSAPASECEKPSSSSSSSSSSADHGCTDGAAGPAADGKKIHHAVAADGDPAVGRSSSSSKLGMEDKQQLSPVSVLDFPFDDDDGDERSDAGTCSPSSFQRCPCPCPPPPDLLQHRTTTKQAQLLHKIRRYDGIAQAVDAVDLDARFTATSESGESLDASTHHVTTSSSTDTTTSSATTTTTAPRHGEEHQSVEQPSREEEEPDEYHLLARLLQEDTAAAVDEISQVLMLDFFAEGIDRLRSAAAGSVVGTVSSPVDDKVAQALLVGAAAEWLRGAGPQWGIRDVMLSRKAALEDMERGRRWMRVGEEERDVGAAVEGIVMDELVDELVTELTMVPSWWRHGDGRRWNCW